MIGVILLIGLGLLLWFFLTRGDDGGGTPPTTTEAPGTVTTSEGQDVLAAAAEPGGLSPFENQTVRATEVTVESVVGDEAFWVGDDATDRLLVVYGGEDSGVQVSDGDTVSFSGILRVLPADFETRFGVTEEEGGTQLEEQAHYVEALSLTTSTAESASPS